MAGACEEEEITWDDVQLAVTKIMTVTVTLTMLHLWEESQQAAEQVKGKTQLLPFGPPTSSTYSSKGEASDRNQLHCVPPTKEAVCRLFSRDEEHSDPADQEIAVIPSTPHPLPLSSSPAGSFPPGVPSGAPVPGSPTPAECGVRRHLGAGSPGQRRAGETPGALPGANKGRSCWPAWVPSGRSSRSLPGLGALQVGKLRWVKRRGSADVTTTNARAPCPAEKLRSSVGLLGLRGLHSAPPWRPAMVEPRILWLA
ncbi:PREDICTED: uncharacterized protein LOC105999688 [Dipodomys ordii]|uniref:Uncharacterized protein LOC105999688 n=1 Tax=Dipodomys ordii TaxID=10020 RepID=A0A1S3GMX4_DIPOR|nr:PREDICTED: uncharacterized protein LOC105999688 [Dipodomys ordii]